MTATVPSSSRTAQFTRIAALLLLGLLAMSAVSSVHGASLHSLGTAAPASCWARVQHPETPRFISPHLSSRGALPTGRWWQNAVLEGGDMPLVSAPYSLRLASPNSQLLKETTAAEKSMPKATGMKTTELELVGVYASLPQREANEEQVIASWRPDLLLTSASNRSGGVKAPFQTHEVVDEDLLSVRVQWKRTDGTGAMTLPLVRGSPYLTAVYSGDVQPALFSQRALLSVNDVEIPPSESGRSNDQCKALSRHHLVLNSGHTVLVYLDRHACAKWDRHRLVFEADATEQTQGDWIVRVAMLPPMQLDELRNAVGILDAFRASTPLAGLVSVNREAPHESGHGQSTLRLAWRSVDVSQNALQVDLNGAEPGAIHVTRRERPTGEDTAGRFPCELLMLTLPHHRSLITNAREVGLRYEGAHVKGALHANVGSEWLLRLHHMSSPHGSAEFHSLSKPLAQAKPEWQKRVRESLFEDAAHNLNASFPGDSYGFGKAASRVARLALIADELDEKELAAQLRNTVAKALDPWLTATNPNHFQYDEVWGGLVTKDGLADRGADYGMAWFNDHLFHIGYFLYAAAVVAKGDPDWAQRMRQPILDLARDVANPDLLVEGCARTAAGENLDEASGARLHFDGVRDRFFPSLRHMDPFEGHSWASGLFAFANGRNQESSSEAVNAYYALALLGRALGDESTTLLGELLTAMEVHGAKTYWHMSSDRSAYPAAFSKGKCVGMVWSDKVVQQTWFATGSAYVHGIQVLPVTPVSELLLSRQWIEEEYPVLMAGIPKSSPPVDDTWLGFAHTNLAVIRPEEAWQRVEALNKFDNGATRTNYLWWVATRPNEQ